MTNRFRNERLEIKLTTEEKELFKKKHEMSKSKSMAHFIVKRQILANSNVKLFL